MDDSIAEYMPEVAKTLDELIAEMNFPCAICGASFGQHNMGQLKVCFQGITTALESAKEAERSRILTALQTLELASPEDQFFRCDVYATIAAEGGKDERN